MSEEMGESLEVATSAPQAAPQDDAPQAPESAPDNTQADTAEQPDEEVKLPKGVQKRIDRLTRERYRLQGELEAIRRQQAQQPEPQRQPTQTEGAPKPEQFQSYEEYLEAKAEWKAEAKVREVLQRQQESTKQQSQQAERAKLMQAWEQRVDEASAIYDDYDEVALAPDVPVSAPMAEAIQRAEKGADVLYYLGKHRDVAAQIAALDPLSAAVAIGRLEATIARPQPRKTTSAPPPISPVGARAAPVKDPAKMSTDEWLKWRNEQLRKR